MFRKTSSTPPSTNSPNKAPSGGRGHGNKVDQLVQEWNDAFAPQKMPERNKRALVQALRSGEYPQGKHYLAMQRGEDVQFCALGVAVDVLTDGDWEWFPHDSAVDCGHWSVIGTDASCIDMGVSVTQHHLDEMGMDVLTAQVMEWSNDAGATFEEIADWLEENA